MPFTLTLPKLSPTMVEGTLVKWHKKEGDFVAAGDLLFEVSTDKATVEHNALDEGWLRKILVAEGEVTSVNQPVAIFSEDQNESVEGYKPEAIEVKPIDVAVSEKSAPKATLEKKNARPQGEGFAQPSFIPEPPLQDYTFDFPSGPRLERMTASPLARKLAQEKGLDLSSVKGSGPGSRIVSRDLERATHTGVVAFGQRSLPKYAPGTFEEVPLSQVGRVVAQRMQEAKTFVPHFYVHQKVDARNLVETYQQLRELEIKISYNDLAIRAAALALREHPNINCGFNSVNQTIVQFKTIDISIAVSTPDGLITPIIRHADYKNLGEISLEAKGLIQKAREGKLKYEEFKGGSFTVSNLGMFGVTDFQAIINPPQVAILAVSGVEDAPVVQDGKVVPGKTLHITLSADHRVIDGVAAAKFIKTVQKYLECPAALLI